MSAGVNRSEFRQSRTASGIVHVTYKGGESEYIVGPNVPVLAYVLADKNTAEDRRRAGAN